jgi:hypothetical protein
MAEPDVYLFALSWIAPRTIAAPSSTSNNRHSTVIIASSCLPFPLYRRSHILSSLRSCMTLALVIGSLGDMAQSL